MINKLMINVKSDKPLSEYGDGHVIVYDKHKGYHYVQTYEQFMQPQNQKIKELEQELERFETKCKEFMALMEEHEQEFLTRYQETNAKVIELVKSTLKGE